MERIVLSGIRATGKLHLGNYLGAIKDFVKLQKENKCFFFVADWHSLTTLDSFDKLNEYSFEIVVDFLSAGLDPKKCTIFLQSDIPEIPELALLLSMFQPANELYVLPTYKDVIAKKPGKNNAGLLYYPILMAADILAHKANLVPVGSDQEIHVRVARKIARRFNNKFGETFPVPQIFEKESIKVPSLDGTEKMGKSEDKNNTIFLTDKPDVVRKKIATAVTDTARKFKKDPGNPFECRLYDIHELVSPPEVVKMIKTNCQTAKTGCIECKGLLSHAINELLKPLREKRKLIVAKPGLIKDVLHQGKLQARTSAKQTLEQVRKKMGLTQF